MLCEPAIAEWFAVPAAPALIEIKRKHHRIRVSQRPQFAAAQ
jgi:hypothetical protein